MKKKKNINQLVMEDVKHKSFISSPIYKPTTTHKNKKDKRKQNKLLLEMKNQ